MSQNFRIKEEAEIEQNVKGQSIKTKGQKTQQSQQNTSIGEEDDMAIYMK